MARLAHLDHVAARARHRRRHPQARVERPDATVLVLQAVPIDVGQKYEGVPGADRAVDAIRKRFGAAAVDYGSAVRVVRPVPDEFRRLAEKEL